MRIRSFAGGDFEALAKLLGRKRHARHGAHSFWQGADELCFHLSQTDAAFVAEREGGALFGAILVRSADTADKNDMLRMHWLQQRTRIAAMAQALGLDARSDVERLNSENNPMGQDAGLTASEGVGWVQLLIADEPQGMGEGRDAEGALWDAGVGWLTEHGATSVRSVGAAADTNM